MLLCVFFLNTMRRVEVTPKSSPVPTAPGKLVVVAHVEFITLLTHLLFICSLFGCTCNRIFKIAFLGDLEP